jgi:hypothetical protein
MSHFFLSRIIRILPSHRKKLALAIYLILITIVIYAILCRWGYDDPFITYRYAANLQNGFGFVYNPGERVLSTTTPLFAMLLALLGELWPDLPHLANLLGAFSLALGALFLWDLAETWRTPLVGWSGLLLYPTFSWLTTTLGSETPLYLAFCLGAFAYYARKRYPITAICVALATLTRPDGILVAIILVVHYFLTIRRPVPWLALGLFLGLTVPWFTFAWVYFGSPLPVTLIAKQHQGAMAISQRFAPGFFKILTSYNKWPYILEASLAVMGLASLVRRKRPWALIVTWTILYFLAYSVLGVSNYFWYYSPLVPGFIVLVGLGICGISNTIFSSHPLFLKGIHSQSIPISIYPVSTLEGKEEKNEFVSLQVQSRGKSPILLYSQNFPWYAFRGLGSFRTVFLVFTAAILLVLFSIQAINLWKLRQHLDTRLRIYQVIGEWLRDYTPGDASVGTLETGLIGYYSQRKMIDFAGLIQPQTSDLFNTKSTYEDAALWAIDLYHPEYLVLHQGFSPKLEQGFVVQHCTLIKHFSGKAYGYSTNIIVYACK